MMKKNKRKLVKQAGNMPRKKRGRPPRRKKVNQDQPSGVVQNDATVVVPKVDQPFKTGNQVAKVVMSPARDNDDESSVDDIPYRKRDPKEDSAANIEGEEDDEGDLDEDEYVVEKILAHRFEKSGTLTFEVQWQGWKETTWEPEENLDGCPEELNVYYKEIGGKPVFKSKSSRTSVPSSASKSEKKRKLPASIARETPPTASKRGRGAKKDLEDEKTSIGSNNNEWNLPNGSWEEQVSEVLTLERDARGVLFGFIMWMNGKKTKHMTSVLNAKCPQKMIEFYESHLQFNPPVQQPDSPLENKYESMPGLTAGADVDADADIDIKKSPRAMLLGGSNGDFDDDADLDVKGVAY